MKTDKVLKKELKKEASESPEKFYAVKTLKKEGFVRGKCGKCGLFFWAVDSERSVCGDSACVGEFSVAKEGSGSEGLSYIEVWKTFLEHFEKRGYQGVDRYPVVARWNPTVNFTIASIAAFQPYVISGEVDPPAKRLVIPQFCLRFGDIDNVGITGSHCTGFVMIGQHQFLSKKEWDLEGAFRDLFDYVTGVVGVSKEKLVLHEDAWAGGGNYGPCMEFFSGGLELFNQVYMMYEETATGRSELKIKVLDMGLGMERIAWFSQGTANLYEAIFPETLKKLRSKVKIKSDLDLFTRFSTYAGSLNIDEVEDIDAAWTDVAEKLGLKKDDLRPNILPTAALYATTEHARALLVAINDGQLPSNTGGGYNLRVILRRALSFIDKYEWDVKLSDIVKWHADELQEFYPELKKNIKDTIKIVQVEEKKYQASKEKAKYVLKNISFNKIDTDKLIELYDSQGISPETVSEYAIANGGKVKVPENFYLLVSERQEERQNKEKQTKQSQGDKELISKTSLAKIPETKVKYYDDWSKVEFKAKVVYSKNELVILDQTYFYPRSGGQDEDKGTISNIKVKELQRIGKHIIHILKENPKLKVGDKVACEVDKKTREQLTQHHSSAHIVNAAARKVLGEHINQAGAVKKLDKAHLDITHFQALSKEEEKKIEKEANRIVKAGINVAKFFMPRVEAEQTFGTRIYQGGVAPGRDLRIVDIEGVDVEACGGTHLNNTSEAGQILIVSSSKISDAVVRLNYLAGNAALEYLDLERSITKEVQKLLNCKKQDILVYTNSLFLNWKKGKKAVKKKKAFVYTFIEAELVAVEKEDTVEALAAILGTQKEHVVKTIRRFLDDVKKFEEKCS